ncbi:MAG TPA: chloride channel protein [Acidimicrobiia bacterium]|jgi:CIC family chloride channel protein|nr:chloride channel protein [Acidimicrobiia bacterium]
MWRVIRRTLIRIVESRGAAAFMTASLFVGVLVGIGTSVLVWAIGGVSWVADWVGGGSVSRWAVLILIPSGLVASWAIDRLWGPGVSSGGVSETMLGLSMRGGYLPTRTIGAKIGATAATLGSGGSAGREGPVVQIGATIGSSFGRYTRFGEDQIRGLVAAGAAAGIAASFNAPIAGMLFALEVILGNFAIRHLNAVVVASVAAAVTARELVGAELILSAPTHSLGHPAELILYAILALIAVAVSVLFLKLLSRTEVIAERRQNWYLPVLFGLATAALVVMEPRVAGTGQEYLSRLLRLSTDSPTLWISLVLIALLKTAATSFTRAGGGSGGTLMPSLVIGGSLGAALVLVLQPVWGLSELNIGAFAVVGMAATFAAVGRAPLTSILIVFEITGDYNLVLPLMLAASLSTFLIQRFYPDSVYTIPLRRRGIYLTQTEDIDLLDTVTVGQVMTLPTAVLDPTMTVESAEAVLREGRHNGLPVVARGRLVGLVTVTDLRVADPADRLASVMTAKPITVSPKLPVSGALARMASLGIGRMPVVSDESPDHYLGMFRRESVVRAYQLALGATTDRSVHRERFRARTQPGASFFEMPIPPKSAVDGKLVKEIAWPEGATLVSVRRGGSVLIPHGDTRLLTGDTLTAFGSHDARIEVAYTVEPSATQSD